MSTHPCELVVLDQVFTCVRAEHDWLVRDARGQTVTRIANPHGLRPAELAQLAAHARQAAPHGRPANRRRDLKRRFWRRLEAALAAGQQQIVTVGALSGYLYALPRRAQIAWAKQTVRAELRPARREGARPPQLP